MFRALTYRIGAAHENFGRVFVHGPLAIANVRHVLDDDAVVRVLVLLVKQPVRRHLLERFP